MQDKTDFAHINFDDLVKAKIPALDERRAKNNGLVLEQIALCGPLLPYDIQENLNSKQRGFQDMIPYSTIYRRIRDLTERGYLAIADKRPTKRGKQTEESMYGLTWRGFIASLSIKEVRENIFQVLEKNPLVTLPDKEAILPVLKEIITEQELETLSKLILEAYLKAIPNLEVIRDDQLWIWLLAISDFPHLPENFKLSKVPKDTWELLDRPAILKVIKEKVVPLIRQKTVELEESYNIFKKLDGISAFISKLDERNKPSKKMREYIQKELPNLILDNSKN